MMLSAEVIIIINSLHKHGGIYLDNNDNHNHYIIPFR
jgi:hypothetical protein